MSVQKAGARIPYTVTFLEMESRPDYDWPRLPPTSASAALLKSEDPPVWWFLALYDAVGRDYAWEDILAWEHERIAEWLSADRMSLYTLLEKGWPRGFFMLEEQGEDVCDLAFFGIVPESVGKGLGSWLLKTAVLTAWERKGVTKLTVETCTLDHPRALALYQKHGFTPVRRERRTRRLTRDRDLSRIPS